MSILKSTTRFLLTPFRWTYTTARDLAGFGTRQDFYISWWIVFGFAMTWLIAPWFQEALLPGSGRAVGLIFEYLVLAAVVFSPFFLGYAALRLISVIPSDEKQDA